MRGSEFAELKAFAAVAESGSFVRASERLGLTASAMSQTIRLLEHRLGVRLLNRTTRSVSLTDAGAKLLARLEPAFQELDAAVLAIEDTKRKPSGTLRIVTPRVAFVDHLEPMLASFHQAYPEVILDITVDDSITDIVARGFDLGIRLGEFLEDEVIAIKLGDELRQIAVASPAYLRKYGRPKHPKELYAHACINWRQQGSPTVYRWEFEKGNQQLSVAVKGPLILNDRQLGISAALKGIGIAMWAEHCLLSYVESGQLVPLLTDWYPRYPGFFAYYRRQRLMPAAMRALIDALKSPLAAGVQKR